VSDSTNLWFSDAEINQQALANASALPYLMVAFARACGRTPEEAASFSGKIFAPGWARLAGFGADEVVRHMALSIVCCGGEVQELTGDATSAEVRVTGVPIEDEAAFFGITCEETDRYCDVFAPIAESLGFSYSWRRDGSALVLSVSRPES